MVLHHSPAKRALKLQNTQLSDRMISEFLTRGGEGIREAHTWRAGGGGKWAFTVSC